GLEPVTEPSSALWHPRCIPRGRRRQLRGLPAAGLTLDGTAVIVAVVVGGWMIDRRGEIASATGDDELSDAGEPTGGRHSGRRVRPRTLRARSIVSSALEISRSETGRFEATLLRTW